MTFQPAYATPRDPGRPTVGPAVVALARRLGWPAMPWQSDLADVAGELDDTGTRTRRSWVVVRVPRRAGKSALLLPTLLDRARRAGPGRGSCWYTAQTQADAAMTWRDEWAPTLAESGLPVAMRHSNGSQGAALLTAAGRVRGRVSVFAPTRTAGHGRSMDAVAVDEAWAIPLDRGAELEAAIRPAGATRPWRQTWIVSAGGTHLSAWLDGWIATRGDDVCVYDCAADPAADDLDDPAVWQRVHPAIGRTIPLDTVRADYATMPRAEFHRAYLCVTTAAAGEPGTFDPARWAACADPTATAADRAPVVFGVDVTADRARAYVVAAAPTVAGAVLVELVHVGPPADAAATLAALRRANRGASIVGDGLSPASTVLDELERRGTLVTRLTTTGVTRSVSAMLDALAAGRVRHRAQPALTASVTAATGRRVGDVTILRRDRGDVSAAVAACAALDAARIIGATRPMLATA